MYVEILLKRQCALRVRKSWAMNAQDTLDIYDMGSIDDIFKSDNPRLMNKHSKQAIRKEWNRRIHVNPPSFVRSLRHFGIAENLRPGDENLRHLTVTSRFKKWRIFLAINSENATWS